MDLVAVAYPWTREKAPGDSLINQIFCGGVN
jgi:hypothetical protein